MKYVITKILEADSMKEAVERANIAGKIVEVAQLKEEQEEDD